MEAAWIMRNAALTREPIRAWNNENVNPAAFDMLEEPAPVAETETDSVDAVRVNPAAMPPSHDGRLVLTQIIDQSRQRDAEAATATFPPSRNARRAFTQIINQSRIDAETATADSEDTSMDAFNDETFGAMPLDGGIDTLNNETFGPTTLMAQGPPTDTIATVSEEADAFNNETFGPEAMGTGPAATRAELDMNAAQTARLTAEFEAERAAWRAQETTAQASETTAEAPADTFNDETFGPAPTEEQEGDFGMYARQTRTFAAALSADTSALRRRARLFNHSVKPMPRRIYFFR